MAKHGKCRICGDEGELDRHHIISKAMCRYLDRRDLIRNDGNVVYICRDCHNVTTATNRRRLDKGQAHLNDQANEKMRQKGPRSKTPPPPPPGMDDAPPPPPWAKKKAKTGRPRHKCSICRKPGHDRRRCPKR